MKYGIKHNFRIESARFLPRLPKEHPCSRTHGHSFEIIIELCGELNEELGWLIDYNDIKNNVQPVLQQLDHRLLNEVPGLENPTSELLAQWIFNKVVLSLPDLYTVRVKETPDTECMYPFRS
ncbi:MAG TPA: 6-carboxytetrahydropterin synthase QueD [Pseudobdellovibrionaceae bacterium]|nr:6-carboxytetrahydropterin synthase QueD [Pseudobdellovibrionaceae bacterium]